MKDKSLSDIVAILMAGLFATSVVIIYAVAFYRLLTSEG